jgi:hypothetical protein
MLQLLLVFPRAFEMFRSLKTEAVHDYTETGPLKGSSEA